MHFDFDYGRYAAYIWPTYIISAAVIAALIATSLALAAKWKREVARLEAAAKTADKTGSA